jgi:hypothetical protein
LDFFIKNINEIKNKELWSRDEIVKLFFKTIPEFEHKETGKFLDNRM